MTSIKPAPRSGGSSARAFLKVVFRHWRPALFMACLLHLPLVKTLLVPLETGAQAWAHLVHHFNAPSATSYQTQPYSVVLISPERFETQYAGRRPLPRTALLYDLQQLPPDAFIALDLDISPLPIGALGIGPSDEERDGEKDLYAYIKAEAHRFLLILPFPVQDTANRLTKAKWLIEMCNASVPIADPRIERTLGIVTREMTHAQLSFARFIRHASEYRDNKGMPRNSGMSGALCDHIAPLSTAPLPEEEISRALALLTPQHTEAQLDQLGLERCKATKTEARDDPDDCDGHHEAPLLSFGKAHTQFTQYAWCALGDPFSRNTCDPLPILMPQSEAAPESKQKRKPPSSASLVILGGDYDLADRFATPLGEKTGAHLHAVAAQRASIKQSHLLDLLADFGLGLAFGLVAHAFWELWFEARLGRTTFRVFSERLLDLTPSSSWIALGLLTVSLSVLTVYALLLAAWLLVRFDLWVSPIPIAIGMTLDAMVLGSAGVAAHKLHHAPSAPEAAEQAHPVTSNVPKLLWAVVIAYVVVGTLAPYVTYILSCLSAYLLKVYP